MIGNFLQVLNTEIPEDLENQIRKLKEKRKLNSQQLEESSDE
jgi:ribosome-associated translation inhibitor RaiA